jgi:hypothetical protein
MNCTTCQEEFLEGERITANVKETFIFKPAHVPDTVNPATVSQEELLESRKEHTRTAIATIYATVGKASLPEGAFNPRHLHCGVLRTAEGINGAHPVMKHSIRFARTQRRGKVGGGQY